MNINKLVLKTIYETRESGERVYKALNKLKVPRQEIITALEFLEKTALIEPNNFHYLIEEDGETLHAFDAAAKVTEKGMRYLENENSDLEDVLESIDELRSKVIKILAGKNPADPESGSISQRVDDLVNEYKKYM